MLQIFVHRGNSYERLSDFQSRLMDQFPNAKLLTKLTAPEEETQQSPEQREKNKLDQLYIYIYIEIASDTSNENGCDFFFFLMRLFLLTLDTIDILYLVHLCSNLNKV